jgi:hypothetical protein
MPRQKDLKRLVRARMEKTGEADTAARAQLLRKPKQARLPDRETAERLKQEWSARLDALREVLAP